MAAVETSGPIQRVFHPSNVHVTCIQRQRRVSTNFHNPWMANALWKTVNEELLRRADAREAPRSWSDLARMLNANEGLSITPQVLTNWKARGLPARLELHQAIAAALGWSLDRLAAANPPRYSSTLGHSEADVHHAAVSAKEAWALANADPAGRIPLTRSKRVPVIGIAKLGPGGFYEQGADDGFVDSYSGDPDAYALRVKGDSMHPAIRHGQFVVVEPNGRCVPGEYVCLQLADGQKMVKELVIERLDEIVVESVNGQHRQTIERAHIERMQAVGAIVPASKFRPL